MVSAESSDPVIASIIANDKTPWYKKPNLRFLYIFLVPCCLAIEATGGFDSSMMNGLQSLKYWQKAFNHPDGAILGMLSASYSLGAITALPFVAILSDHVGRRWAIMFGSLVMMAGAVLQCFSVNSKFTMWIFARIFLGHGFPYCVVSGSSLIGELAHPKERARLGSLFNAFYFVGALLAAGITLQTLKIKSDWSWKLPSILQMAPSVLQVTFIFFIPESPRWLLSKDRGEEALAILKKYHDEAGEEFAIAEIEFAQIKKALEVENESRKRGWAELFQSPGMRRRSLIGAFLGLFTQFSGNTLISAYLVVILKQIGFTNPFVQNQINVGLQGWNLVVAFCLALFVSRFPRRRMYLLCASCLLCVYTGWTIAQARQMITGSYAAGITVIAFIFLYQLAYSIGYNALTYVYLVEIFPYFVRTKGISWFQLFGKGAGFFSTFVNPIALKDITWRYLIVYIVWLAFEICFIYFLFPETHNRSLEELAFLFEPQEEKDAISGGLEKRHLEDDVHIEVLGKQNDDKV
ncbi:general substrate transporter [Aaosphaeria arxii CBS 175.79]|uniref:General substrate transporter n=1 Tax=Aaosphaeria arxii CBS 175.79 TaxID=1450172 RepID=A0A6A5X6E6_9PLEO|nr:general substrate transporter [Aaosphaeria arxii CBS 175.79]KAF2008492.1 general substrate transporter [Aaosphaeria arxii CBS 175.79]